MERQALRLGAVVVDEVRPFLGVFLEALVAELLEERFVELIDVDDGCRVLIPAICVIDGADGMLVGRNGGAGRGE